MAGTSTSSSTLSTQATGSIPRRSNETIPNFSRPHTPRSQTAPPEPQDLYHPAEVTTSTAGTTGPDEGEPVRLDIAPVILATPVVVTEPEPEHITILTPESIPGLAIADLPTASIPGLAIAEPPGDMPGIAMSDPDPGPGPADIDTPLPPRPSITQRPPTAASTTSSTSPPPPHARRARIAIVDAPPPPTRNGADSKSIRSQIAPSICSPEDEVLSLKVRSLYDSGVGGSDAGSQFSKRVSSIMEEAGKRASRVSRNSFVGSGDERFAEEEEEAEAEAEEEQRIKEALEAAAIEEEEAEEEKRELERGIHLRAGGAEDWEDLNGSDVDRYGFIHTTTTRHSAPAGTAPPTPRVFTPPRRVSTALHLHSTTPQKRSHHLHLRISPFGHAAPEMLRSPLPGATALLREKENNRAKKWRDMAVVRKMSERGDEGGRGGGCEWGFVTGDPKLISRTWKGIPDCWRAAAWHAFLTASRKRRGIGRGDGELVEMYAEFITRPSADDVQIDLDVPRTINSHIMFRRRYRGGQRLLFRVLHALSLYFPAMGYVQGMASLAATLLCYYDEETAFVMLIRMFELRGLEKLYQAGFGGLMSALEEFENGWIRGGTVSRKLNHLGIGPTTYGTRWYLTLFNYSMPFPAQLRVWDVFMLLGDPDVISESKLVSSPLGTAPPAAPGGESAISADEGFGGTLDILHATSAALIDSMKDIIVRSDFEGAMKVLTSWIPVKDEELLMKVAKSEWKMRKRRRGGGGGVAGGAHHHPGRASLGT